MAVDLEGEAAVEVEGEGEEAAEVLGMKVLQTKLLVSSIHNETNVII